MGHLLALARRGIAALDFPDANQREGEVARWYTQLPGEHVWLDRGAGEPRDAEALLLSVVCARALRLLKRETDCWRVLAAALGCSTLAVGNATQLGDQLRRFVCEPTGGGQWAAMIRPQVVRLVFECVWNTPLDEFLSPTTCLVIAAFTADPEHDLIPTASAAVFRKHAVGFMDAASVTAALVRSSYHPPDAPRPRDSRGEFERTVRSIDTSFDLPAKAACRLLADLDSRQDGDADRRMVYCKMACDALFRRALAKDSADAWADYLV